MTALLEIADLEVRYGGIRALRGVSLTVEEGEIVALLGSNGAGKTTTLRTISGLLRPAAGRVFFKGEQIDDLAAHEIVAMGISHAPEGRRIFARMSVQENLEMGAYQRRGSVRADLEKVFGLFPVLQERRRQAGGTLSGGEQQMLAIGRALMSSPQLLLLDEPSMGLAPMMVGQIFRILHDIQQTGTTIFLVEQNAAQALAVADRGYVLETGRIVMAGPAGELLRDDRVRAAYLGEGVA
jgi:branched-chain amino acid transport system ATP-binding protein